MINNVIVPAFFWLYLHVLPPKHPSFEEKKKRYYFFYGGRGSGKSYQVADYIISEMRRGVIRVLCTRETQKSIKESVHNLLSDRINELGLSKEFEILANEIKHFNGSYATFCGLRDHTVDSIKSYQGFDICWVEEAHSVSKKSLTILIPTIRRDPEFECKDDKKCGKKCKGECGGKLIRQGSHFIFTYNRYMEADPVHVIAQKRLKDSENKSFTMADGQVLTWTEFHGKNAVGLFINAEGNQYFPDVLAEERREDYEDDKELADHVWGGQPIGQAAFSIFTRDMIKEAVERTVDPGLYGRTYIGVDVARYGDDKTVMYKRRNNTVLAVKKYKKLSVPQVAALALELGEHDPEVQYNIDDTGVGGGVTDIMTEAGWRVTGVNFASKAGNHEKYDNIVAEMVFNVRDRINELDLPDIPELREELTGRVWYLTLKGKRAIERKRDFKKRIGRSCDDFDAFILAFHEQEDGTGAAALGSVI